MFNNFLQPLPLLSIVLKQVFIILISSFLITHAIADTPSPSKLPTSAFASLPDINHIKLSPNGEHIAVLQKVNRNGEAGKLLRVINLEKGTSKNVLYSDNKEIKPKWFRWANDEKILVSAIFTSKRQKSNVGGQFIKVSETRILVISADTGKAVPLLKKSFVLQLERAPQYQDHVVDMLPDDPDHILLEIRNESVFQSTVYKININSRKIKRVQRSLNYTEDWLTDHTGTLRVAIWNNDTTFQIKARNSKKDSMQTLWKFEAFSKEQVWPLGFDKDPNILYVRAYHGDLLAIFKVDLTDPELNKELVYSNPHYDVEGSLFYSPKTGDVVGITEGENNAYTFWDKSFNALQNGLNKALPDTSNSLISFSRDESRYILYTESDIDSGTFYFGDRNTGELSFAGSAYSLLSPDVLSKTSFKQYTSRDGITIDALITLPKGKQAKNLPTIIHPHGGPISSDDGSFDYWTQYFANQGYAVLQMNFRGSSGYGFEFKSAGLKNWGQEMQGDIEDGTRWMIKQGIADPERICIVGASYGGYAALVEAAYNSDLYQCAVSFAGVTNLRMLLANSRYFTNYEIVKDQIGSNRSELKRYSPSEMADEIDVPILLVHGDKDLRVDVKHSRQMAKRLEKANKNVTYVEQEGGNHHLSQEVHRLEFFNLLDTFLKTHLQ